MAEYKPINEVKMDVMEQKFVQDTTEFDSYVKITDNTYYFYTLDDKELYAKVDVRELMFNSGINLWLGFLLGMICLIVIIVISSFFDL